MMTVAGVGVLRLEGRQLLLVRNAVIASYDPALLEQDLRFELNRRLDEITAPDNLSNVTFHVLDTAEREGWLRELLVMFKNGRYPGVREVATRVLAQLDQAPKAGGAPQPPATAPGNGSAVSGSDPFLSHLVGQQPFIDRTVLHKHLEDLISDSASRVLVITGERPCGKSYTWFYVRQPELLGGITPVLVDLSEWADPSHPVEVMSSIALQLGLTEPTIDEHAQGAAQAQRLRDWLVGQLQPLEHGGRRWLLVFDSLDHPAQRDDTLQLIEFVAGAAIRQRVAGLRVILLGYANRLPISPLEAVLEEEIHDIGKPELRDFFLLLAQHAGLTISDQAVDLAVNAVLSLLPDEREGRLCQLQKTVREIGNAAFGRKVLP
jgi:Effector-associated domain 1